MAEGKDARRRRLHKNMRTAIMDAHKDHKELIEMEPSQDILGIVQLYAEYTIGKSGTTPKDDTLRGIMDSKEDFRNRRSHEEEDKKIMEWRKIFSVLSKYLDVYMCIIELYNDGATCKTVGGHKRIDDNSYDI